MNPGATTLPATRTARLLEIDGMRAIVALWVVFDHFGISALVGMHYGFLGVRMMLILSAYFAAKQLRLLWASGASAPGAGVASKLVHYYSSRVVRLGLLAYATVAIALAFDIAGARSTWQWHVLFATNHYITRFEEWPGALSHFWSLAVQMQFLLLLPLALILIPRRWLLGVLCVGILAAIGHRAGVLVGGASEFHRWMPVANSLDAFALGIALAWLEKERTPWFRKLGRPWAWGGGLVVLGLALWLRRGYYGAPLGVLTETVEAAALVILFGALVGGYTFGPVGRVLRSRPVVLLGGASLSLYALHPIAEQLLGRLWRSAGVEAWLPSPLFFQFSAVGAALLVAWAAFHLLEIPSRQIAAMVEPRLTRLFTRVAEGTARRAPTLWRWQPAGAACVCLLLLLSALSPLQLGTPSPLNPDTLTPPVAVEAMEEFMEEASEPDFSELPDETPGDLLRFNLA